MAPPRDTAGSAQGRAKAHAAQVADVRGPRWTSAWIETSLRVDCAQRRGTKKKAVVNERRIGS